MLEYVKPRQNTKLFFLLLFQMRSLAGLAASAASAATILLLLLSSRPAAAASVPDTDAQVLVTSRGEDASAAAEEVFPNFPDMDGATLLVTPPAPALEDSAGSASHQSVVATVAPPPPPPPPLPPLPAASPTVTGQVRKSSKKKVTLLLGGWGVWRGVKYAVISFIFLYSFLKLQMWQTAGRLKSLMQTDV